MRARDDGWPFALCRMRGHEAVDAIERVGGDAAAIAQPRRELAVIHRAAAEGGFGEPRLAAIIGNFLEELLRIHGATPLPELVSPWPQRLDFKVETRAAVVQSEPRVRGRINHKFAHSC